MLRVPRAHFEEMVLHAERDYPEECCGVLVGVREGEENRAARVFLTRNVALERRRDRFEMDPRGICEADDWGRSQGMEIVGFYHSHPDHPPVASATDNDRARPGIHDGYSFLILSIQKGRFESGRSFTLSDGRLEEEPLSIE